MDPSDYVNFGILCGIVITGLFFVGLSLIISYLRVKKEREIEFLKTLDDKEYRKYCDYKGKEALESLK